MRFESESSGENIPLLSDKEKLPSDSNSNLQDGSIPGAVFNVSTTMIGAGIMSIPATIKVLGIVPGFLVIVLVAIITDITVEFMLRYSACDQSITYAGMVSESYGKLGSLAAKICIIITNLGVLVIYFIILGDVLCGSASKGVDQVHAGVLQEWLGFHWWTSRPFALFIFSFFLILPFLLYRRIDSLRYSSGVSILLALVFVAISSSMAFYALWSGESQSLRLFPDFSKVSFLDIITTIPIFVTGFGFHPYVHPIRAELREAGDMKMAVRYSLIICVAIYFATGFFGYLLFGDSIMTDMLVNFDQSSNTHAGRLLNDIVRLSYAVHLALVFPVINFSMRLNIDELLFSNDDNKPELASDTPRFMGLTLSLFAVTYVVAVAIPNIWYFFQFLGSTTIVTLAFIVPPAIILRDKHGIATTKDRVLAAVVAILAAVTSGIAIWTNLHT